MKKLLFLLVAAMLHTAVNAQVTNLKVNNRSGCSVDFFIVASDPSTCDDAYSSVLYTIPATSGFIYNIGTITWAGTPPPPGSSITAVVLVDCTGLGYSIGDPCTGLPPATGPITLCSCPLTNAQYQLLIPNWAGLLLQ